MTARPDIKGSYEGDWHRLDYWTCCPNCDQRKECEHNCDTTGWMRLYRRQRDDDEPREGAPEGWHQMEYRSGIITLGSIKHAVKEAFETEQMRLL